MTDQDKLIEEAAKVIAGMDWLTSMHLEKARAVFSLVEKAQGEPSCRCTERQIRYDDGEWSRELEVDASGCPIHRREQGEPSDALDALDAILEAVMAQHGDETGTLVPIDKVRAALRAAGGVR